MSFGGSNFLNYLAHVPSEQQRCCFYWLVSARPFQRRAGLRSSLLVVFLSFAVHGVPPPAVCRSSALSAGCCCTDQMLEGNGGTAAARSHAQPHASSTAGRSDAPAQRSTMLSRCRCPPAHGPGTVSVSHSSPAAVLLMHCPRRGVLACEQQTPAPLSACPRRRMLCWRLWLVRSVPPLQLSTVAAD